MHLGITAYLVPPELKYYYEKKAIPQNNQSEN
jgi:hypothetical protein